MFSFTGYAPAVIYLAAVFGVTLLLIAIFYLLEQGKCFCYIKKHIKKERTATSKSSSHEQNENATSASEDPGLGTKDDVSCLSEEEYVPEVAKRLNTIERLASLVETVSNKSSPEQFRKTPDEENGKVILSIHWSKKDMLLGIVLHNVS